MRDETRTGLAIALIVGSAVAVWVAACLRWGLIDVTVPLLLWGWLAWWTLSHVVDLGRPG